ncbi:MAG: leucine--tRNA ligase [Patescibacteria group bacterium]|jgi:leucyl-tRNA synthetase
MEKYNHKKIEDKWREKWEKEKLYKTGEDKAKPKFYILDMFPYPSGAGLHVGHPKGYIATDIFARAKMMQGYNVLHPMGWDAFGLPAENYAIQNKIHPRVATEKNIETFKSQLKKLGFTYDWDREINTTDPGFYKWTQWTFIKMFERGLAYESNEPVNWCPSCKTVLSNEDLENGKCERCGSEIERKPMRQWVLKITDYAERMLNDLEKLPYWEESIKEMQKNWIGRSEGAEVDFEINGEKVTVFTTRPDTLFGATFFVMAPEHPLVKKITTAEQKLAVEKYIKEAASKSDMERTELAKEKTGVFTGAYAVNPVNQEKIPVYIADYVMMGYGTGAIMAVPAHDERDWEFAIKYDLKKLCVIKPETIKDISFRFRQTDMGAFESSENVNAKQLIKGTRQLTGSVIGGFMLEEDESDEHFQERCFKKYQNDVEIGKKCHTGDGVMINSDFLNDLDKESAIKKMTTWLEEKKLGKRAINYKIKDWVFSRQRYWGEPIPIVHCEKCGNVAVPENELPLKLPEVKNYEPTGTGESPLANIKEWVNTKCPKCGGPAKRETNTMPQWAGSSWYYLRYIDPKNDKALIEKGKDKYWSPVDFYVGGAEHATRHLIYARFWHKFLFDIGVINYDEPFTRLQHVGLILAEDGRKMSKRWHNVINPDEIVEKYGADAMRVYEMFMGPFSQPCAWSTNGLIGARRFLENVYKLNDKQLYDCQADSYIKELGMPQMIHKTIKKVSEDIENFRYNTAIAQMMIFVNFAVKFNELPRGVFENFLKLLAPFAPHLAEELWFGLGNEESIFKQAWPKYNPALVKDETINLVIQVNGKIRDTIEVSSDISEEEAKKIALESEKVKKWLEGKEIKKVIFVKGKLVNIVIHPMK